MTDAQFFALVAVIAITPEVSREFRFVIAAIALVMAVIKKFIT
jgi:hypothetical protein